MKMPIALVCLTAATIAGPCFAVSAAAAELRPAPRAIGGMPVRQIGGRPNLARPDPAHPDPARPASGKLRLAAAVEPTPLDAGAPGPNRDAEPPRMLRRLPAVAGGWRLAGEIDRREWVVRLSEAEARRPARLQIALRSAVSVMPEGSRIAVAVNGTPLGEIVVGGRMEAPARLDIPAGLLAAGANVVTVEAKQRHRVDCSIDATYELWTEIDPTLSGLSFESPATPAVAGTRLDLAELATLWPNERGETRITAILPPGAGQDLAEAALGTVARVALIAGADHPVAAMATAPGTDPASTSMSARRCNWRPRLVPPRPNSAPPRSTAARPRGVCACSSPGGRARTSNAPSPRSTGSPRRSPGAGSRPRSRPRRAPAASGSNRSAAIG
ncbi:cellulose biosynthesis cyclic di-GMP-binding regulatory protein BcsB [Methyloraptor flagellatus]|uniref:cellulose biosynthesis cyclic di-GMP-binding regulatory protein BcsB n=1 Tax=Methyloraptor flagellatus TaxID=3162530 RepID=UPI00387DCD2E